MTSGFIGGVLAGAAVSGVVLVGISVLVGPPQRMTPNAVPLEVPAGSEFNQSREDTAARLPQSDGAPEVAAEAPQVDVAQPDDLSAVDAADTQPSSRPETGEVGGALSAPEVGVQDSGMGQSQTGIAPSPGTQETPRQGADDPAADLPISADPTQPSQPEVESDAGLSAVVPNADEDAEGAQTGAVQGEMAEAPAAEDTGGADTAETELPSSTIGNLATGVETSRLPSVGDPAPAAAPADAQSIDADGTEAGAQSDEVPRAIDAFAQPFENPEGKPLMSIVLIDDGSSPIGLDALAAFPYPLSFAVDASWPGAAEAMRRYRDAGFEVLAIADLPEGADARDTETTMLTVMQALPEAVAIMEGTGTGLQFSREASEQLAPILLDSGHGLVLFSKGLETAPKLISREGVPVGTVFRDFDDKAQSAAVIRRFLDQAAFKAGRDAGGVIMLGRLRADTISALLLWGLQDRASQVALAPVSAVLSAAGQDESQ